MSAMDDAGLTSEPFPGFDRMVRALDAERLRLTSEDVSIPAEVRPFAGLRFKPDVLGRVAWVECADPGADPADPGPEWPAGAETAAGATEDTTTWLFRIEAFNVSVGAPTGDVTEISIRGSDARRRALAWAVQSGYSPDQIAAVEAPPWLRDDSSGHSGAM